MKVICLSLLIGIFAGVLAGLCGVGGGIVMVPAFAFLLGMDQKAAVATSVAVIVPTAIVAMIRYSQAGLVQWNVFWPTAIGALVTVSLATGWLKKMSNDQLTKLFAVVMILVGVAMLVKKA